MSYLSEMDWSEKWDWEIVPYGSKAIESPKKLQLADWMTVDDREIENASFNLSGDGGNSGACASDGGHGSSAKSSVSASIDSSIKDGRQKPDSRLVSFEGCYGNLNKKMELERNQVSRISSPLKSSFGSRCSVEPLIGLKLGKRTYFENSGVGDNVKSNFFNVMPTPSATTQKKVKSSGRNASVLYCQVDGCNIDLSMAKEYHQKHRVCDGHSKSPKVTVGGLERRFCQQCSRFHGLSEFDEKKRSCRKRLSDHNARRRKPQPATLQFKSMSFSTSVYGERQQMGFLLNNAPLAHSETPANYTRDNTCNSKFTLTNGYALKSTRDGGDNEQLHMSGVKLSRVIKKHGDATSGFLASKGASPEVLSPGSNGSLISSHSDAAPAYCRALSLLSNSSAGSYAAEFVPVHHPMHEDNSCITGTMMNAIPEGVPISYSSLCSSGQHLSDPRVLSFATNRVFQEIKHLTTPYEVDLYSNMLS